MNMELITADEAKRRSFKHWKENTNDMNVVMQMIDQAIEEGIYEIKLENRIGTFLKNKLEMLGYRVLIYSTLHTTGETTYFTVISWE